MGYTTMWPSISTHLVDDDGDGTRTLCGTKVDRSWDTGGDWDTAYEASEQVSCRRCQAAAKKRAKEMT